MGRSHWHAPSRTIGPQSGCTCCSERRKSGWISRRTCSCASANVATTCVVGATTDALFRLAQVALCVPQSHDHDSFRKSTTKVLAQVASMHHGGGRRGGNANHVGFALLDKINQLAGRGRNRDGPAQGIPRHRQQLRQHHSGDFIRLVASGQAEDAKPWRDGRNSGIGSPSGPASLAAAFACISCWPSPRS